jgi:hypothetical protein
MNSASPHPNLAFILSLPRSGSTVLAAMLDRRRGIVSPPESSFPQVLGAIAASERTDSRVLAALYLGSTFTPSPLSLREVEECMKGSNEEILTALGLATAAKFNRSPSEIKAIIWKTPRTVGMQAGPLSTNGKFVVLRRNPHNVFESQFRVGFGENNRRPLRFAIFRESYENAFARLPADRVLNIQYDDLPGALDDITRFLGIEQQGEWTDTSGSFEMASKACGHMSEVMDTFVNRDPEKRARLEDGQVRKLARALKLARPLRPFLRPLRAYFDGRSLEEARKQARKWLETEPKEA